MIAANREPDRAKGKRLMTTLIDALSNGVPAALTELITLGRTLKKRAEDVLASFDRPGTSNGPTEAINAPSRASPQLRPRLPHPRQLHRPELAGDRRVQAPTTPWLVITPPAGGAARPSGLTASPSQVRHPIRP